MADSLALRKGQSATAITESTSYMRYWIGQIAKRYNEQGPDGMRNRQHTASWRALRMLSVEQHKDLRQALSGPAPDGAKRWRARDVADWIAVNLGRPVATQRGWDNLQRLKHSQQASHPRHALADAEQQDTFKKKLRPLLQAVATAFPHVQVEPWATDEHRIGLKPLLRRVWAPIGQRPIATVQQRFAWRYLVGFVHPAAGCTVFHLATTVSIPMFEVELAAFARQVGASLTKQAVLVLDRAKWHTSIKLQAPDYVHLLFLPPYSPELQLAEHLWPLTNAALINQHFATIEDLEDAQCVRCADLQQQRERIRSTTLFH